uniref:Uncharacterized protein n=1 Tax=Arundo donax TaxID=35708 RepID=A0A0A8YFU2_ARUDO
MQTIKHKKCNYKCFIRRSHNKFGRSSAT